MDLAYIVQGTPIIVCQWWPGCSSLWLHRHEHGRVGYLRLASGDGFYVSNGWRPIHLVCTVRTFKLAHFLVLHGG